MKKFIFILSFIILATINANAQENEFNTWSVVNLEGDELLDTQTEVIYVLTTSDGDKFVHYTTRPKMIVISSENGVFDFESSRYSLTSVSAVIGYYDLENNLIDKETTKLYKIGKSYAVGFLGTDKLMDYLRNGDGYVRFVIKRYTRSNLDVVIPTWKICPPKYPENIASKITETTD